MITRIRQALRAERPWFESVIMGLITGLGLGAGIGWFGFRVTGDNVFTVVLMWFFMSPAVISKATRMPYAPLLVAVWFALVLGAGPFVGYVDALMIGSTGFLTQGIVVVLFGERLRQRNSKE
ncbi:hypothetical protein HY480_04575 [Candidatus Uhrbacteria bacterium]|nr:hypothetical protein [Candidatus Uhrbacteria bacterium]